MLGQGRACYHSMASAKFCGDPCLDCFIQADRLVKSKKASARCLASLGLGMTVRWREKVKTAHEIV